MLFKSSIDKSDAVEVKAEDADVSMESASDVAMEMDESSSSSSSEDEENEDVNVEDDDEVKQSRYITNAKGVTLQEGFHCSGVSCADSHTPFVKCHIPTTGAQ